MQLCTCAVDKNENKTEVYLEGRKRRKREALRDRLEFRRQKLSGKIIENDF